MILTSLVSTVPIEEKRVIRLPSFESYTQLSPTASPTRVDGSSAMSLFYTGELTKKSSDLHSLVILCRMIFFEGGVDFHLHVLIGSV